MPRYNPFDKAFQEVTAVDLAALRDAVEGWYIEYKREAPSATSMAKSVAAFANTYGGYLFYGVAEKSKEEAVAGAFPGIPRRNVDAVLQCLRQAVAGLINPAPHFETRVVWGPSTELGLSDDHGIVCVYIPWGPNAPYVHKSGQIYRRVADGSEPKPENDRFVLDQLWRRSEDLEGWYREWIERDPVLSRVEENSPFVRILISSDLWEDREPWLDADIKEVRAILGSTTGTIAALPFDTIYTSATGFIGRQLRNNDPYKMGLTWRLSRTLTSEVIVPLNFYDLDDCSTAAVSLSGYEGAGRYTSLLRKAGHRNAKIVDLNLLFNILIGVADTQGRLMTRAGWVHGFHFKSVFVNIWRTVPFIDMPLVLDEFEHAGVPMMLDETVIAPAGKHPNTFDEISMYEKVEQAAARPMLQALGMFAPIARAYGVPPWMDNDDEHGRSAFFNQLLEAGNRALARQSARAGK
jgi:hypothetical protein